MIYDQGVLLAVDKNVSSKLIVPKSIEKIFQIDDHIGVATSGLVADARRLIEDARVRAQRNKLLYDEPVKVSALTRELCDIKQAYTQYGGARPFGTALLIAGVNSHPHLYETDPSGAFTQFTAGAIGMGKRDVEKLLEEKYERGQSREKAVELAILALNHVSEGKVEAENIDIITIEVGNKYAQVSSEEIAGTIKKLGSELDSEPEGKE